MSSNISSQWTSTDPAKVQGEDAVVSVKIRRNSFSTIIAGVSVVVIVVSMGGFLFLQGVGSLRVSLLDEMENAPHPNPNPSLPTQTIKLGTSPTQQALPTVWPTVLKINRYTVGSAFVPDLAAVVTIPVNTARGTPTHSAAPGDSVIRQNVRSAPATGPALWVLVVLSLCVVPVYFFRVNCN